MTRRRLDIDMDGVGIHYKPDNRWLEKPTEKMRPFLFMMPESMHKQLDDALLMRTHSSKAALIRIAIRAYLIHLTNGRKKT